MASRGAAAVAWLASLRPAVGSAGRSRPCADCVVGAAGGTARSVVTTASAAAPPPSAGPFRPTDAAAVAAASTASTKTTTAAAAGVGAGGTARSVSTSAASKAAAGGVAAKRNATPFLSGTRLDPSESFLTGANATVLEDMYERYLVDPSKVHSSWVAFFRNLEADVPPGEAVAVRRANRNTFSNIPATMTEGKDLFQVSEDTIKLMSMIRAFRHRGHLVADLDPLRIDEDSVANVLVPYKTRQELEPSYYGFTEADMDREFVVSGELPGPPVRKLREVVDMLRTVYLGKVGYEYRHMLSKEEKVWLASHVEAARQPVLAPDEKKTVLRDLADSELFEAFLAVKHATAKRFGMEGAEAVLPGLQAMVEHGSDLGIENVVVGMPHRGRLNVLANLVHKPLDQIFHEFTPHEDPDNETYLGSGDVKYHLGTSQTRSMRNGRSVHFSLMANPSHLEAVDPVVVGKTRAKQFFMGDTERKRTMGLLLHGDASFAGQGVVAETLELSDLRDYTTGGTIHVIVNNQIGFTTDPRYARSSPYPTDVGKLVGVPIFHVNGDDVEAALTGGGLLRGALLSIAALAFVGNLALAAYGYTRSGGGGGGMGGAAAAVASHARGVFSDVWVTAGWQSAGDGDADAQGEAGRRRSSSVTSTADDGGGGALLAERGGGGGRRPPEVADDARWGRPSEAGDGSDADGGATGTRTAGPTADTSSSGKEAPTEDADLAIFIQVAAPTLPLLPRLLWTLDHPRSLLLVHYDAKMGDAEVAASVKAIGATPGRTATVRFMERELVTYRGVSMVLNTLSAIHAALQGGPVPWTHFLNISAADYPLISPAGMRRALGRASLSKRGDASAGSANGSAAPPTVRQGAADATAGGATPSGERVDQPNYLQLGAPSFTAATRRWRYEHIYMDTSLGVAPPRPSDVLRTGANPDAARHRLIGTGEPQPLYHEATLPFAAAEAWMILTREACEYIAHSAPARRLLLAFAGAAEPEEHYFASLLLGEPRFASTIVPHALREVVWAHRGVRSGQHPFILDSVANWTAGPAAGGAPSSVSEDVAAAAAASLSAPALPLSRVGPPPADEGVEHYVFRNRLLKSTALFARKFAVADSPLMAFLDAHKSGITVPPPVPSSRSGEGGSAADAEAAATGGAAASALLQGVPPGGGAVAADGSPLSSAAAEEAANLARSRVATSLTRMDTTLRCLRSLVPSADPWTSCLVNEQFLRRLPPVPGLPPSEFWLR